MDNYIYCYKIAFSLSLLFSRHFFPVFLSNNKQLNVVSLYQVPFKGKKNKNDCTDCNPGARRAYS